MSGLDTRSTLFMSAASAGMRMRAPGAGTRNRPGRSSGKGSFRSVWIPSPLLTFRASVPVALRHDAEYVVDFLSGAFIEIVVPDQGAEIVIELILSLTNHRPGSIITSRDYLRNQLR